MVIERFEVSGLAQYAYIVSDGGEAVAIDPIRDIDRYLDYLRTRKLRLKRILETHIHADFAAGSVELAEATGAELAFSGYDEGERYVYAMPHRAMRDGDVVTIGGVRLEARHTPGHTPEHLSFLLYEKNVVQPLAMFTGDFLFVGSMGRPDLLGEEAKVGLAHELYRSAKYRLADLPDGLLIYPGHGAGSFCGAGMGERATTTLGYERATNLYFSYGEEEFVREILASAPPMPAYYPRMKMLNAQGAPPLHGIPGDRALTAEEVAATQEDVVLIDLRSVEAFAAAHIVGSINIGAGLNFSLWAGWLLASSKRIVLIADAGNAEESRRALVRVGLDNIVGVLPMETWIEEGRDFETMKLRSVIEVERERSSLFLLDVRNADERTRGIMPGAHSVAVGDLPQHLQQVPRDAKIVTVCASGYRASIAASLLAREGYDDVSIMDGGTTAWTRRSLPLVTE